MSEDRQIQSMIDFIEREAQEKADELDAAAQEEYDVEKMRLVELEKSKIRANIEKRKKQVEVDRRVTRANHAKAQRLRVMQDRATILDELNDIVKKKIMALVGDATKYRQLLVDLVRQALIAIRTDAVIECRKQDEQVLSKVLGELQDWYKAQTGNACTLSISKDYLPESEVWGGVVLQSRDGRIVCNNTLSYRARHCFGEQTPTVRFYLFNPEATL